MQVVVHADVALPPAQAWARLADLSALKEWAPDVVDSPADPLRLGAVRRARLAKPAFGKDVLVERVMALTPPQEFTYDIDGGIGPFRSIRTTWIVARSGAGSRVSIRSDVELGGVLRVLPFLARRAWTKQMQELADAFAAWAGKDA